MIDLSIHGVKKVTIIGSKKQDAQGILYSVMRVKTYIDNAPDKYFELTFFGDQEGIEIEFIK